MIVIAKYSASHAVARAGSLPIVIGFAMIACTYGRGEAANVIGAVSTAVEVKALLHRRVELTRDGSISSDVLDRPDLIQVNEQECDPAPHRDEATCVFLIYEIQ